MNKQIYLQMFFILLFGFFGSWILIITLPKAKFIPPIISTVLLSLFVLSVIGSCIAQYYILLQEEVKI